MNENAVWEADGEKIAKEMGFCEGRITLLHSFIEEEDQDVFIVEMKNVTLRPQGTQHNGHLTLHVTESGDNFYFRLLEDEVRIDNPFGGKDRPSPVAAGELRINPQEFLQKELRDSTSSFKKFYIRQMYESMKKRGLLLCAEISDLHNKADMLTKKHVENINARVEFSMKFAAILNEKIDERNDQKEAASNPTGVGGSE